MRNELKELLELITKGHTVKTAAAKLGLNARTCEAWISDLREEAGARHLAQLIAILKDKKII